MFSGCLLCPLTGLAVNDVPLHLNCRDAELTGRTCLCKYWSTFPHSAFLTARSLDTRKGDGVLRVCAAQGPIGVGRNAIRSPPRQAHAKIFASSPRQALRRHAAVLAVSLDREFLTDSVDVPSLFPYNCLSGANKSDIQSPRTTFQKH